MSGYSGPAASAVSPVGGQPPTPLRPAFWVVELAVSFVLESLLKGLGLSGTSTFLCIIFLCVCGILSYVLGGGDFSYGLGVFDLSHDDVKWAVVCFICFFLFIARAA